MRVILFLLSVLFLSNEIFGHGHSHDLEDIHDDPRDLFFDKHDHHHHHHEESITKRSELSKSWIYPISSVLAVSMAPCVLLFFIPSMNADSPLLRILLAFGAGGLLGDAFLHIIPHSFAGHGHQHDHHQHDSHHHDHDHSKELKVGLFTIIGILAFMIVEEAVRIAKGGHCHSHTQHHDHVHENEPLNESSKSPINKEEKNRNITATAYLNLFADFAHNLTDGLAIGASFSSGNSIGMLTTITVLLHELPHEIGDFAILVQSGFSKWQAIRVQMITAIGAFFGCIISLLVADADSLADNAASSWIMPFTAGGFIYIATVSVIPELLESATSNSNQSKCMKIAHSISHILSILIGVIMMYFVSFME